MSFAAIRWATFEAPIELNGVTLSSSRFQVLHCLAWHANENGTNVWPSRRTISEELWGRGAPDEPAEREKYLNACETKVKRAIRDLRAGGWIVEDPDCRHAKFLRIPEGRRPTAWRLRMDLRAKEGTNMSPGTESSPGTFLPDRGDNDDPSGGTKTTERGDENDPLKVTKGSVKREGRGDSGSPASAPSAHADTASDGPDAPAAADAAPASTDGAADAEVPAPPPTGAHWVGGDPRCDAHRESDPWNIGRCHACKNARLFLEACGIPKDTDPGLLSAEQREAKAARQAAIDACGLCGPDGKITTTDERGYTSARECSHFDGDSVLPDGDDRDQTSSVPEADFRSAFVLTVSRGDDDEPPF